MGHMVWPKRIKPQWLWRVRFSEGVAKPARTFGQPPILEVSWCFTLAMKNHAENRLSYTESE